MMLKETLKRNNLTIKILKGTIVKIDGLPLKLTKSLKIKTSESEISLDDFKVVDEDQIGNLIKNDDTNTD